MSEYVIMTDNCADLPDSYYREHDIVLNYLNYTIDGKVYQRDNALPYKEFYQAIRDGAMPTTSQATP